MEKLIMTFNAELSHTISSDKIIPVPYDMVISKGQGFYLFLQERSLPPSCHNKRGTIADVISAIAVERIEKCAALGTDTRSMAETRRFADCWLLEPMEGGGSYDALKFEGVVWIPNVGIG